MRIPLDYYRILGLPIQATAEQLQQAHRDRTLQLPRREYSTVAIESRRSLLDEAYGVLADAQQRQAYDRQFLATTGAPLSSPPSPEGSDNPLGTLGSEFAQDAPTPTIEVTDKQWVGALLILLELGEYELVIRLGRPFLARDPGGSHALLAKGRLGEPQRVLGDIVLTLALACLELGREQWQQRHYEQAAESLAMGQELLVQENLLPDLRAELQGDLYKLRPYRVLELVARPLEQGRNRRQGIKLLKEMLQDRGGIDGTEDDQSGLSTEDFLRFIQQLRTYLTAGEQQEIFEAEARRPSAVAIYLAVYALLARGFAFHQPALVRRAKHLLGRVSKHQDVYLEQAVCALLLGQTEEASRFLELSQEYEPLAFIREHSQGAPDWLPGLCLYGERWLREEVFPHFRDLAQQSAGLKQYFADPQVQAYLEAMPLEGGGMGAVPLSPGGAAPRGTAESSLAGATESAPPLGEDGPTIAERVAQLSPEGQLQRAAPRSRSSLRRSPTAKGRPLPPWGVMGASVRWGRLGFVVGVVLIGLLLALWLLAGVGRWLGTALGGTALEQPALEVSLTAPAIEIPTATPSIGVDDIAQRTLEQWFAAKGAALGPERNVAALGDILVNPALADWQQQASAGDRDRWYWQYRHELEILGVQPQDPSSEILVAQARVREVADFFELGVRDGATSYDATLTMRYELVRQGERWFVRTMQPLEGATP